MKELTHVIKDPAGLHARPAGILVKTVKACSSTVSLEYKDKAVDARKLFAIMALAVPAGEEIKIFVEGENEEAEYETIKAVLSQHL